MLGRPQLGFFKVYGDALPSDYAFRVHGGSDRETICLLIFLWTPGSKVCLYEGSTTQVTSNVSEVAKSWGLLATPKVELNTDDSEHTVTLEDGGLYDSTLIDERRLIIHRTLQDSRLQFSVVAGIGFAVGFGTEEEVKTWGTIDLPDSDTVKAKVRELERQGEGIVINSSHQ